LEDENIQLTTHTELRYQKTNNKKRSLRDSVTSLYKKKVTPFSNPDKSLNFVVCRPTGELKLKEGKSKLTAHFNILGQEYYSKMNKLENEFVTYWTQPKRSQETEDKLAVNVLDETYNSRNETWKKANELLYTELFEQNLRSAGPIKKKI
jgi:hypothetical protein